MADLASPSQAVSPHPLSRALYDQIMAEIEPDLLTENLDRLKILYAAETNEESADRADRYAKAFEIFDAKLAEVQQGWGVQVKHAQKAAFESMEKNDKADEQENLEHLEQSITSA